MADVRQSAAKRGYDHRWNTVIRPAALARNPLCAFHLEKGRVVAATVVDHIDGNSRNNSPDNLRSLCKSCHDRRTATDQGFARSGSMYPKGIKRSRSPVVVVCGPPFSGKTKYIQDNKGERDFVIDWDNVAFAVAGVPMHQLASNRIPQIVFFRNQLIAGLEQLDVPCVWLEESGAERWKRQHWVQSLGASVVVLETPADICIARVARAGVQTGHGGPGERAELWWAAYTVDYTDRRLP